VSKVNFSGPPAYGGPYPATGGGIDNVNSDNVDSTDQRQASLRVEKHHGG